MIDLFTLTTPTMEEVWLFSPLLCKIAESLDFITVSYIIADIAINFQPADHFIVLYLGGRNFGHQKKV